MASDPTPIWDAQAMEDARAKVADKELERLKSGGGGGTFGGMEPRIAKLEAQMEGARSDLGDLKVSASSMDARLRSVEIGLATLAERVAHLPSKGFIVSAVLSTSALLGVLTLFGDQIKALFAQ